MVIDAKFDVAREFKEGFSPVKYYDVWGVIKESGSYAIPLNKEYEEIKEFSCGMAAVKIQGKWGFIDRLGNLAVDAKYQGTESFFAVNNK